ncbi:MAG: sel1 repeat family protein [Lysobacteraceae bacterium]|nr:MAG: sel1 repeat family protein [Xanthomonadaceae bacterium]
MTSLFATRAAMRCLPAALACALLLVLSPAASVALAADTPPTGASAVEDGRQALAVQRAWDRYAELSSKNSAETADFVASASDAHFEFLRDAALYAAPEQLRRIPLSDRILVYLFRMNFAPKSLKRMNGRALIKTCATDGWCGMAEPDEGEEMLGLTYVTVLGDQAIGEYGAPTENQFQFGPVFVRENGQWRFVYESLAADSSDALKQQIADTGMSTEDVLALVVAGLNGKDGETPQMAVLDRAMIEDSKARTRLNEQWPKYEQFMALRGRALERKATQGESQAQFLLGALLYSGAVPSVVAQDKTRGLALMEQASDGGHLRAASAMVEALLEIRPEKGQVVPMAQLTRLARHSRRAAEGGMPVAALVYGGMLFNGAGGLQRDCQQAEEWVARAEDGGIPFARNERVWFLATCPIPAQRRPARAMELAAYMVENAASLSAGELDTVAATYAANGKFSEAVNFQQRAIDKLEPERKRTREQMNERLALYRRKQDWVDTSNAYAEAEE